MHFRSKLVPYALLELYNLSDLLLFDFLSQITCCDFVVVHELVPLLTKLLKFSSLGGLCLGELLFVQNFEVLVPALQFSAANLFYFFLTIFGLLIVAVLLTLLSIVVQQSAFIYKYLRKSMSRSSTVLHMAYLSSICQLQPCESAKINKN